MRNVCMSQEILLPHKPKKKKKIKIEETLIMWHVRKFIL